MPFDSVFEGIDLADDDPRLLSGALADVFATAFAAAFFLTLVFFDPGLGKATSRFPAAFFATAFFTTAFFATGDFAVARVGAARAVFAGALEATFFTAFFADAFFTAFLAAPVAAFFAAAFFAAVFFTAARFIANPLQPMSAPQSAPAQDNELATLPFTQLKRASPIARNARPVAENEASSRAASSGINPLRARVGARPLLDSP
ncbi:MAG: hypothetical protein ABIS07_03490 [Dokdonella sp.]